jgi:hypothetical protein
MAKIYEIIPGLGTGRGNLQIAVRSRIYRGPDHLLILQSTGYTEEYKRIFYRDIRYVEIRKTQAQIWHAVISGVFLLLVFLLYFVHVPGGLVAVFCFPFFIWFLANLLRGPTCDCFVSTNVQTLKIPAPGRMKKVPIIINFLRTRTAAFDSIETSQPVA